MPNPTKKHVEENVKNSDISAEPAHAEHSKESGVIDPRATQSQGPAGEQFDAPQQYPTGEPFELLVDALASLAKSSSVPTAAGVYSRMRRNVPGFTFRDAGFASFREFLDAAKKIGLVTVERYNQSSDVLVKLTADSPTTQMSDSQLVRIPDDLWKAMVGWNSGSGYSFNRSTKRTTKMPATVSAGSIPVPSISKATQVDWMREFAAGEAGDVAISLVGALDDAEPAKAFMREARQSVSVTRRWKKYMQKRVLECAQAWADRYGITSAELSDDTRGPAGEASVARQTAGDEQLRKQVLNILTSMPLSELLRLPVPIEYSIGK